MSALAGWLLGAVIVVAVVLGLDWLIWLVWCWVLPQVWPSGPATLLAPGFWLFSASWLLIGLFGQSISGRSFKRSST